MFHSEMKSLTSLSWGNLRQPGALLGDVAGVRGGRVGVEMPGEEMERHALGGAVRDQSLDQEAVRRSHGRPAHLRVRVAPQQSRHRAGVEPVVVFGVPEVVRRAAGLADVGFVADLPRGDLEPLLAAVPGQGFAEPFPFVVVVRMHDEVVHLGIEDRRLHRQGERGPRAGRADRPQFAVELRPVVGAVVRVDAVVLAEEEPDGSRPELAQLLDVRLDHRVALQSALAEGERGHVPRAVGLREINAEADRFRGGERGTIDGRKKSGDCSHCAVSG